MQTITKPVLTIRVQLTDGSVHAFGQSDSVTADRIWDSIDPRRFFARQRLVIGSEHSKTVFVCSELIRVDLVEEGLQCWKFPEGYADVVELCKEEFREHTQLDHPELMPKRESPTAVGDMLVSFLELRMRGGHSIFVMVEFPVKLPVENHSFMQFLLSKGSAHMRLREGGVGVINLANLLCYKVYPGVAQIPIDSWLAEPVPH